MPPTPSNRAAVPNPEEFNILQMHRWNLQLLVRLWIPRLLALAALSPMFAHGATDRAAPLNLYQKFIVQKLQEFEKAYPVPSASNHSTQTSQQISMAACELRVWKWTGEDDLLANAQARLKSILEEGKSILSFFEIYPLTWCVDFLSKSGRMDSGMRADFGHFVASYAKIPGFSNPLEDGSTNPTQLHNQSLLRTCGFANAAILWPDSPSVNGWKDYVTHFQSMLSELGDVTENAPNYDRFDAICICLLQDMPGQSSIMKDPGMQKMFLRYRDQIAPSGAIPSYGDSGKLRDDESGSLDYNNVIFSAAFEKAAAFYNDPTLRWAALKNFEVETRPGQLTYPEELFYLSFASDWANPDMQPESPVLTSAILTRKEKPNETVPDKLILRSSPGAAIPSFLEVDLFGRGSHSHPYQKGAITYFEENKYPVVTMLGYNNRQPEHANLFLMAKPGEGFPLFQVMKANQWVTTVTTPITPATHEDSDINMRVTGGKNGVTLWVSGAAIQSARGERTLKEFLDPEKWAGLVHPNLVQEDGRKALCWKFPSGINFAAFKGKDPSTDFGNQFRVKLQWKLSNIDETVRPLILRFPEGDYNVSLRPLIPVLKSYAVEDRGKAHYGTVTLDNWFIDGTTTERRMVLFDDGVLVVYDTLIPDPTAEGMTAGPVWNPASQTVKSGNLGEFLIGPPDHLYSLFLNSEFPMQFGAQTTDVWGRRNQTTVYGNTAVAGCVIRTVSVFLPGKGDVKPVTTWHPDGIQVSLPNDGTLSFSASNHWQITSK